MIVLLPHTHAQGVKSSVCMSVVVVVGMKITRFPDIRVCVQYKYSKSLDIHFKKLPSVLFQLLNMVHKLYKSCIFPLARLGFTDHTHSANRLV